MSCASPLFLLLLIDPSGGAPTREQPVLVADRPAVVESAPDAANGAVAVAKARKVAELVVRMDTEDGQVREEAFHALRVMDKQEVGPEATKILRSSRNASARRDVLRMFRQMEYDGAYREITQLLSRDEDPLVRREASHALVDLSPKHALGHLKVVAMTDSDVKVRRAAVLDMGSLKSLDAAEALLDVMHRLQAEGDAYLMGIVVQALRLTTGKDFGDNLPAWEQYVAGARNDSGD